jgi:hypothetical protein
LGREASDASFRIGSSYRRRIPTGSYVSQVKESAETIRLYSFRIVLILQFRQGTPNKLVIPYRTVCNKKSQVLPLVSLHALETFTEAASCGFFGLFLCMLCDSLYWMTHAALQLQCMATAFPKSPRDSSTDLMVSPGRFSYVVWWLVVRGHPPGSASFPLYVGSLLVFSSSFVH